MFHYYYYYNMLSFSVSIPEVVPKTRKRKVESGGPTCDVFPRTPIISEKRKVKKRPRVKEEKKVPTYAAGIYVDGGQNGQTGDEAWGCVTDEKGTDLIPAHSERHGKGMTFRDVTLPEPAGKRRAIVVKYAGVRMQNNGAELLALVFALRFVLTCSPMPRAIHSDSSTVEEYWSKNRVRPETRQGMPAEKVAFIEECAALRKQYEAAGGAIVKIEGKKNPADLGYHKGDK